MKDERPGSKARTTEHLANDLMLAQEVREASHSSDRKKGDIGESPGWRGRAIFLVGAGCSKSAGIPLAPEIAQRATTVLAARYLRHKPGRSRKGENAETDLAALIKAGKIPSKFRRPDGTGDWEALYPYIFSDHIKHPNHQREMIASLVGKGGTLNWAHACLGELVAKRYVHTVLTTNFDQLVLEGIIRTGIIPVVADGLESLSRIDPSPSTPQVVHLHGSMHTYDLRNSQRAVSETSSDESLRSVMRELLRQSTVLVIVGYRGGEEGIMDLLQAASESFPRMVIYWVAYEKDYRDLSLRAKTLIHSGENTFFVIDQDADRFFQRLMREMKIGQPFWIEDPIRALKDESSHLSSVENDEEIGPLVEEYRGRISYADDNREKKDDEIIRALQARLRGEFEEAIDILKEVAKGANYRARRLYAQSWRDKFYEGEGEDLASIKRAIHEFRMLVEEEKNPQRCSDAWALIDATWDLHDRCATSPLSEEDVARLKGLLDIIEQECSDQRAPNPRQLARFLLYRARVSQELSEKAKEGQGDQQLRNQVLASYRKAWASLRTEADERFREAEEGLAAAIVADAEFDMKGGVVADETARSALRERLNSAIQMHKELTDFAWYNSSSRDWAGSLANLATAYHQLAQLERGMDDIACENAFREAIRILSEAVSAYEEADDETLAGREQARISEIEQYLQH